MKKFNAASYQRKVTNHKNRRQAVIAAMTNYIQDVVKENGTITFPEPKKFKMSYDEVVALHFGRCPKPYMEGETYDVGVVLELSIPKISKGFLPKAVPLSSTRMVELLEVAEAIEELTHSPAPIADWSKEVDNLNAIFLKESSEMIDWIKETIDEANEVRLTEPLNISVFSNTPILAVSKQRVKDKTRNNLLVEHVCLMVESENKLIGKFEKKVKFDTCPKQLTPLLTLAKAIDMSLAVVV